MAKIIGNDEVELIKKVELYAIEVLKDCTDDYASRIWALIRDEVIADVLECTADEKVFTRGDICLAIGRALLESLGGEV